MKAKHINPFLKSTIETFKVMVNITVTPGAPFLCKGPNNADISSMIELSGEIRGSVVMAYPLSSALNISSKFLGEEVKELNSNVADCIGEIANIVTGFAKKELQSMHLSMSLPSIMRGPSNLGEATKENPVMGIPFDSELGKFTLEVKMTSNQ